MASSFKSLRVWQDAMGFTVNVYHATAQFPRHELCGLTQQPRRAAVSVPSNIAEGKGHRSDPPAWIAPGGANATYDRRTITILVA
jgi:hypothetical protein